MLKATVSQQNHTEAGITFELEYQKDGYWLNGEKFDWDLLRLKEGSFHILKDHQSYVVEVLQSDPTTKTFTLKINKSIYTVNLQDRFDLLINRLGMKSGTNKVSEIKAPMPGLILGISVSVGQQVQKGDTLLILEAMKMENALKSPIDGEIKNIKVKQGENVEKNHLLIEFK
ncbi:MAG: acetyl-CoA carboxylase biotin carboxyl carrier protein subunit [Microscillaceae bacterium]|nr:acetyl-CoA carboxylase biotin carboxyl carrier protein subunit [Microscillaceae bacterium]